MNPLRNMQIAVFTFSSRLMYNVKNEGKYFEKEELM